MVDNIKARIFLVGCPRSGTTYVQSMISRHPGIKTFPETHFYYYLKPSKPYLYNLGLASRSARPRFMTFLEEINRQDLSYLFPIYAITMKQVSNIYLKTLDYLAQEQDLHIWLEKTPIHLFYIELIKQFVPHHKFIHLIRRGDDVVASLFEIYTEYRDQWGKDLIKGKKSNFKRNYKTKSRSEIIDQCIKTWKNYIHESESYLGQNNHLFVNYETMKENFEPTMIKLCNFMEIDYQQEFFLTDRETISDALVLDKEPWKKNYNPLKPKKFMTLFTEDERQYIIHETSKIDLARI